MLDELEVEVQELLKQPQQSQEQQTLDEGVEDEVKLLQVVQMDDLVSLSYRMQQTEVTEFLHLLQVEQ